MSHPAGRRPAQPAALHRLWTFVRVYRRRLAVAIAALLLTSGSLLALPKALGAVMDSAFAHGDAGALATGMGLLLGLVVVLAAGMSLRTYMLTWIGERVVADIRARVYDHLLGLPMAFFDARRVGEVLSRLTSDVAQLQSTVGIVVSIALRSAVQLSGALVLMAIIDWQLTILVVLVAPLVVAVAKLLGRRVRRRSAETQDRQADIANQMEQSLNALMTVKAYAAEEVERRYFRAGVEAGFRSASGMLAARAALTFTMLALAFGAIIGVAWIGGQRVLDGSMSGGTLTEFALYTVFLGFSVSGLAEVLGETRKAMGATERLFGLLDEPPEAMPAGTAEEVPEGGGALEFEALRFAYPARPESVVLDGLSLKVRAGETIALVGASGVGKSTLFRLLLRLYEPQAGRISFDGTPLSQLDPHALRQQFAVVLQEPAVFAGDAMQNIRYGFPGASDAEVIEAARLARADEFIARLPQGYATPLGDKGHLLSTGQRQRLAIARAILRAPRVLLLDEATSALDRENERLVQEALAPFMAARTTLVIAHRLNTVLSADRVVMIEQGRVAAQGTHAELMASCPAYAGLVDLEFAGS